MTSPFDPSRKFVRIVAHHHDGMVEFEFAVGEPELFVEMRLPQAAFDDFCATQGVQPMAAADRAPSGLSGDALQAHLDQHWTLHDAIVRSGGERR